MDRSDERLERAFQTLRAGSMPASGVCNSLESRIMKERDAVQRKRRRAKTSLLALLTFFVFGGGFTVAGGADVVKRWFTRLEIVGPADDGLKLRATDADGNVIGDIVVHGGESGGEDDESGGGQE